MEYITMHTTAKYKKSKSNCEIPTKNFQHIIFALYYHCDLLIWFTQCLLIGISSRKKHYVEDLTGNSSEKFAATNWWTAPKLSKITSALLCFINSLWFC